MKKYKYVGNKEYWYPNLRSLERTDTITGNSLTVSIYEDNKSYKIANRAKKEKLFIKIPHQIVRLIQLNYNLIPMVKNYLVIGVMFT